MKSTYFLKGTTLLLAVAGAFATKAAMKVTSNSFVYTQAGNRGNCVAYTTLCNSQGANVCRTVPSNLSSKTVFLTKSSQTACITPIKYNNL